MKQKTQKLTIHNIAKMANVSPGTVSRVLSGKPGVGDEPRQRIQSLEEQQRLRVLQRRVARRKLGGAYRRKTVLDVQRLPVQIANRRKNYLDPLAFHFISHYDRIAREDLNISGMARNYPLSKSILDAGWGYLRTHLASKAVEAGREIIFVNPADTSKTCCACGALFPDFSLSVRWVDCSCGLSMDRDVNAAFNILNRAGPPDGSKALPLG